MPAASISLGEFADIDAVEGFTDYDGPCPPRGTYRCVLKWMKLIEKNGSGNPMFKALFEVQEPKGAPKEQFNGYAIFHNANITAVSAPWLNAMLDGLGLPRKGKIILSSEKPGRVVKIGGKSVDGIPVMVGTARVEYPVDSDEWKLEAKTFTPAKGAPVSTSKDEDDGAEDDGADEHDGSDEAAAEDDAADDDAF